MNKSKLVKVTETAQYKGGTYGWSVLVPENEQTRGRKECREQVAKMVALAEKIEAEKATGL